MHLTAARVEHYRSILDSGAVPLDPRLTVLLGRNESGKTAFLQALDSCRPAASGRSFDVARDYPRRLAHEYARRHHSEPAVAARLTFRLEPAELDSLNRALGFDYFAEFEFAATLDYANAKKVRFTLDEAPVVAHWLARAPLPPEVRAACGNLRSLRDLLGTLGRMDLGDAGRAATQELATTFAAPEGWDSLLEAFVWRRHVEPLLPRFFYFDEYTALPDKVNLADLAARSADPGQLTASDRTVLALLDLAGVRPDELAGLGDYELLKTRLEGAANAVADTVFRYWRQGRTLDVELDCRADPADAPPYNRGPNLYVRVRDRQDRSSVAFSRRSRGFVWFLSFVVAFEAVRRQPGKLILLLDEPGLNLHPLAQEDLLRYVESLAEHHQTLLSTHSPFLIPPDRLGSVRLVSDVPGKGTVVHSRAADADAATLHPLRVTLAAELVRQLPGPSGSVLVPEMSDLVILQHASGLLRGAGRAGLPAGVRLIPAGPVRELARALLGGDSSPVVSLGEGGDVSFEPFHAPQNAPARPSKLPAVEGTPPASEDLLSVGAYLKLANAELAGRLPKELREADLPPGGGVAGRAAAAVERLAPDVTFDRYLAAQRFATGEVPLDKAALARFEALFAELRARLKVGD